MTASPNVGGTCEELYALADAVAAVIGGSVSIEDLDNRVLAYSSIPEQRIDELRRRGILDRRVPDQPEHFEQYRQVLAATGVVRLPILAEDELPRAAVAIRAGERPLGTIWAIEGATPMDAAGEAALLDGARLAATHLLRQWGAAELDRRIRENALRGLLTGEVTIGEARARLGLPDPPRLTLLGLASPNGESDAWLSTAATRHWAAVSAEAATATINRTVYILLPNNPPATARRLAEQAVAALDRTLDAPVRCAQSRTATAATEVPTLRAEVDDILRVITADPDSRPVTALGDVHARVLLMHFSDELARHPALRHPGIEAMLKHDRTRRTHYAASVVAWLDAAGNIGEAARSLTVHPNTLKYRLRRVCDLFGVDLLGHPDDRLSCWLQLRLQH
ncbi:PucR family transcriptional regulator [Kutzneria chonburiensis]|uniref:PucR family transcriptional regulator n=1 Tax=Kutzneria chonburiensis TaxID=1483604 RepID=A0ABV6MJC1_9PSEU|nr:helix-turn-helix domain-containing protein [Kutzneria chonburiensis]